MSIPSAASNRTRSPNYPSMNLEEAIDHIRTIYTSQRRYPSSREVLVKLIGYNSLNGASAVAVANLSKYGLLEGHGDSLRVSELGQDLALHRNGDPEFGPAVLQAAGLPTFFRQLDEDFPDGLPSDHSIRASLMKRGFTEKAIVVALKAYRETHAFIATVVTPGDQQSSAEESSAAADNSSALRESSGDQFNQRAGARPITIPLPGGEWASLTLPIAMTSIQFDQLLSMLHAMRASLVSDQEQRHTDEGQHGDSGIRQR